jgi:hypothetical protein
LTLTPKNTYTSVPLSSALPLDNDLLCISHPKIFSKQSNRKDTGSRHRKKDTLRNGLWQSVRTEQELNVDLTPLYLCISHPKIFSKQSNRKDTGSQHRKKDTLRNGLWQSVRTEQELNVDLTPLY